MKRLLCAFPLLLACCFGQSVTFNGDHNGVTNSGTSVSVSFTVTAGHSNLALIVPVAFDGSGCTATSLTAKYNSVSMTANPSSADAATGGGTASFTQVFSLANPATGSNTLTITLPASCEVYYDAISFYNVNQSTPLHNHASATGSNPSPAITSGTSELVVAIGDKGDASAAISFNSCTPSAATCTSANNGGGNFSAVDAYSTVGESSVTVAFASSGTNSVATGFSIQPPSGGGPTCPHNLALMGAGCS